MRRPARESFASGREPITVRVAREVRGRILRGQLQGGTRLTEVRLATALGVSRTPLREALRVLAGEGFLEVAPGRGYRVVPLSSIEVRELFAIIAELEVLALHWGARPDAHVLGEMTEVNAQLAQVEGDAEAALRLNAAWHRLLFARCPNGELRRMIEDLRVRIYRYEYHYFAAELVHVATAVALHRAIMEPLVRGDLDKAAEAIRLHWWTDLDEMLPRLI